MAPQRPQLYETLKTYVIAALPVLEARLIPAALPYFHRTTWQQEPDQPGIFRGNPEPVPLWDVLLTTNENALQALPEYQACVDVLKGDPEISRQLDTLVGSAGGRTRFDARRATHGVVSELLKGLDLAAVDHLVFDADRFEKVYADLEAALLESMQRFVVIAPIKAFSSEKPVIDLGDAWTIGRMGEEERKRGRELSRSASLGKPWGSTPLS